MERGVRKPDSGACRPSVNVTLTSSSFQLQQWTVHPTRDGPLAPPHSCRVPQHHTGTYVPSPLVSACTTLRMTGNGCRSACTRPLHSLGSRCRSLCPGYMCHVHCKAQPGRPNAKRPPGIAGQGRDSRHCTDPGPHTQRPHTALRTRRPGCRTLIGQPPRVHKRQVTRHTKV